MVFHRSNLVWRLVILRSIQSNWVLESEEEFFPPPPVFLFGSLASTSAPVPPEPPPVLTSVLAYFLTFFLSCLILFFQNCVWAVRLVSSAWEPEGLFSHSFWISSKELKSDSSCIKASNAFPVIPACFANVIRLLTLLLVDNELLLARYFWKTYFLMAASVTPYWLPSFTNSWISASVTSANSFFLRLTFTNCCAILSLTTASEFLIPRSFNWLT